MTSSQVSSKQEDFSKIDEIGDNIQSSSQQSSHQKQNSSSPSVSAEQAENHTDNNLTIISQKQVAEGEKIVDEAGEDYTDSNVHKSKKAVPLIDVQKVEHKQNSQASAGKKSNSFSSELDSSEELDKFGQNDSSPAPVVLHKLQTKQISEKVQGALQSVQAPTKMTHQSTLSPVEKTSVLTKNNTIVRKSAKVPGPNKELQSLEFWLKQNEAERFSAETRTRKMVQDCLFPILDNQATLQAKVCNELDRNVEELFDRMEKVEFAVYRTEKADTRFDKIYAQLAELEAEHVQDQLKCRDNAKQTVQAFEDAIFKMEAKVKELEKYKQTYDSVAKKVVEMQNSSIDYMNNTQEKMNQFTSKMEKDYTHLQDFVDTNSKLLSWAKFEIGKLSSQSTSHLNQINVLQDQVVAAEKCIATLEQKKCDLLDFETETRSLNEQLLITKEISHEANSQTKSMITFIEKFEPVYVQRQITQCLTQVFPDTQVQWRLNWFNDVKMPLLLTQLLYNTHSNIDQSMASFRKVVELKSLTAEESFMKNSMASKEMHHNATEILAEAMGSLMADSDTKTRDINIESVITELNMKLMQSDQAFAEKMGIADTLKMGELGKQSPEELAKVEAERERMMQESMQQTVIDAVIGKIRSNLEQQEKKLANRMGEMSDKLDVKFEQEKIKAGEKVTALEKYLEAMHAQQIKDYEKLKKINTDAALGVGSSKQITGAIDKNDLVGLQAYKGSIASNLNSPRTAAAAKLGKHTADILNELKKETTSDFVLLGNEQQKLGSTIEEVKMLLKELIRVNIDRERQTQHQQQTVGMGMVSEAGGESVLMQETKSTNYHQQLGRVPVIWNLPSKFAQSYQATEDPSMLAGQNCENQTKIVESLNQDFAEAIDETSPKNDQLERQKKSVEASYRNSLLIQSKEEQTNIKNETPAKELLIQKIYTKDKTADDKQKVIESPNKDDQADSKKEKLILQNQSPQPSATVSQIDDKTQNNQVNTNRQNVITSSLIGKKSSMTPKQGPQQAKRKGGNQGGQPTTFDQNASIFSTQDGGGGIFGGQIQSFAQNGVAGGSDDLGSSNLLVNSQNNPMNNPLFSSHIVSQLVQLDRKVSELNNHRQAKCYNCLSGVQEANKRFNQTRANKSCKAHRSTTLMQRRRGVGEGSRQNKQHLRTSSGSPQAGESSPEGVGGIDNAQSYLHTIYQSINSKQNSNNMMMAAAAPAPGQKQDRQHQNNYLAASKKSSQMTTTKVMAFPTSSENNYTTTLNTTLNPPSTRQVPQMQVNQVQLNQQLHGLQRPQTEGFVNGFGRQGAIHSHHHHNIGHQNTRNARNIPNHATLQYCSAHEVYTPNTADFRSEAPKGPADLRAQSPPISAVTPISIDGSAIQKFTQDIRSLQHRLDLGESVEMGTTNDNKNYQHPARRGDRTQAVTPSTDLQSKGGWRGSTSRNGRILNKQRGLRKTSLNEQPNLTHLKLANNEQQHTIRQRDNNRSMLVEGISNNPGSHTIDQQIPQVTLADFMQTRAFSRDSQKIPTAQARKATQRLKAEQIVDVRSSNDAKIQSSLAVKQNIDDIRYDSQRGLAVMAGKYPIHENSLQKNNVRPIEAKIADQRSQKHKLGMKGHPNRVFDFEKVVKTLL